MLTIANYIQRFKGDQAAIEFIAQHVKNDSGLRGSSQLINLYLTSSHQRPSEKLTCCKVLSSNFG